MPALAARDHSRHERLDAVDHAPEIDAEHPLPVPMRRPLEPAPRRHARVVAEDVDDTERLPGALGERLDLAQIAYVRPHGERVDAVPARLSGHGRHRSLVDIRDHDPRALARQRQRERPSDPATPARDDRDLPLERIHDAPRYPRPRLPSNHRSRRRLRFRCVHFGTDEAHPSPRAAENGQMPGGEGRRREGRPSQRHRWAVFSGPFAAPFIRPLGARLDQATAAATRSAGSSQTPARRFRDRSTRRP